MALKLYRGPAVFQPVDNPRLAGLAGIRLASFRRRALALGLDFLLAGVSFLAVVLSVGNVLVKRGWVEDDVNLRFTFFSNWYSLIWLVLYFGLSTYWGQGRTPAKRLLGIRIVSLTHERISLWHAVERALAYGASALEAGFGFFQYFTNPNRQTVHDRIAETIVIDERRGPATK